MQREIQFRDPSKQRFRTLQCQQRIALSDCEHQNRSGIGLQSGLSDQLIQAMGLDHNLLLKLTITGLIAPGKQA